MLTPRQQFKFGFLLRCADEGLDPQEIQQRAAAAREKVAQARSVLQPQEKTAATGLRLSLTGIVDALKTLGWFGIGGSALAGAAGGYGLAKMTDKDADPEEVKRQELTAAYQQQADRVRRAMRTRRYRQSASAPRETKLI